MVYHHTLEFQGVERVFPRDPARTQLRELKLLRLTSDIFIVFVFALVHIVAINHRYIHNVSKNAFHAAPET